MAVSTLIIFSLVIGQLTSLSSGQGTSNETLGSIGRDMENELAATVTAFSAVQVVGLTVILLLATLAIILVLIFRKRIYRELGPVLKIKPPCSNCTSSHDTHSNTDDTAQLQGYREVPNDLNQQDRLNTVGHGAPEEIGFHVSTEAHEMHETSTGFRHASPAATNPFNHQQQQGTRDLADDGYLTRATYRYDQDIETETKRDLSYPQSEVLYDNPSPPPETASRYKPSAKYDDRSPLPETAMQYDQMEEIEGEIIEEVDYQNVTIVRTKVAEEESDQDYVSVDMNESSDEDSQTTSSNANMLGAGLSHHPTTQQDNVSFKSSQSYENFDPKQNRMRIRQPNLAQGDESGGQQDDLYMNVASAQAQSKKAAGSDSNSMEYQNVDPRMYKRKHH